MAQDCLHNGTCMSHTTATVKAHHQLAFPHPNRGRVITVCLAYVLAKLCIVVSVARQCHPHDACASGFLPAREQSRSRVIVIHACVACVLAK